MPRMWKRWTSSNVHVYDFLPQDTIVNLLIVNTRKIVENESRDSWRLYSLYMYHGLSTVQSIFCVLENVLRFFLFWSRFWFVLPSLDSFFPFMLMTFYLYGLLRFSLPCLQPSPWLPCPSPADSVLCVSLPEKGAIDPQVPCMTPDAPDIPLRKTLLNLSLTTPNLHEQTGNHLKARDLKRSNYLLVERPAEIFPLSLLRQAP